MNANDDSGRMAARGAVPKIYSNYYYYYDVAALLMVAATQHSGGE